MKDILLNSGGDIEIAGDLAIGDALYQNQALILLSSPGEWKQSPTVGVGIEQFLEDEDDMTAAGLFREIREQLTADGMTVKTLKSIPGGKIGLDATY